MQFHTIWKSFFQQITIAIYSIGICFYFSIYGISVMPSVLISIRKSKYRIFRTIKCTFNTFILYFLFPL